MGGTGQRLPYTQAFLGQPTGKHTRRILPCGMKLDVFMVTADTWGLQLAIRTGSAAFSKYSSS
jgi:hypothetical protein